MTEPKGANVSGFNGSRRIWRDGDRTTDTGMDAMFHGMVDSAQLAYEYYVWTLSIRVGIFGMFSLLNDSISNCSCHGRRRSIIH